MSLALVVPWVLLGLTAAGLVWDRLRTRTERRHSATLALTLAQTETRLRRISQAVESASDAIGIGDFDGHSLYHNRAHVAMFGYTEAELNAVPESGALFADPVAAQLIHASIRAGKSWAGEVDVKTKDGRRLPAYVRADLIRDERGQPVGIFGVFTDITERRLVAQSLEDERRRLAITLQSIADGVITTDPRGRVELMNRVAEQLTGWRQGDARRLPLSVVFTLHLEGFDETYNPTAVAIGGPSTSVPLPTICGLRTRSGEARIIAEQTAPLGSSEREPMGHVIVFRDITIERQRAADRERADRLESLGLLAGGIAHDFANLLTAILGHISLAQSLPELPPRIAPILAKAEAASWRARDVTKQLLAFASGGPLEKKPVELAKLVREAVSLVSTEFPSVEIRFHFPANLAPVEADATQLGQVFHNLALNSAQAMEGQGSLFVKIQESLPESGGSGNLANAAMCISFSDTGRGIPPENLSRIFDPFFTTKKTGTGLGLATCYSIVKQHGGDLKVESSIGFGTTFRVFLPIKPASAPTADLVPAAATAAKNASTSA